MSRDSKSKPLMLKTHVSLHRCCKRQYDQPKGTKCSELCTVLYKCKMLTERSPCKWSMEAERCCQRPFYHGKTIVNWDRFSILADVPPGTVSLWALDYNHRYENIPWLVISWAGLDLPAALDFRCQCHDTAAAGSQIGSAPGHLTSCV